MLSLFRLEGFHGTFPKPLHLPGSLEHDVDFCLSLN